MARIMKSPLIQLEQLVFAYPGQRRLFDSLELTVTAGERICIGGRNGAGKTSLLLMMVGLLKPESGRIVIFGRECRREADFREVRGRVGLVFQDADDQLFCPTVLEDLCFGPLNLGKSPHEAHRIAVEVMTRVGLAGFEDRLTTELSGGEKRLVSLATVLAMEPEVLLLDEPTGGLDDNHVDKILQVLLDLPQAQIIVSHDQAFTHALCTRHLSLHTARLHPR